MPTVEYTADMNREASEVAALLLEYDAFARTTTQFVQAVRAGSPVAAARLRSLVASVHELPGDVAARAERLAAALEEATEGRGPGKNPRVEEAVELRTVILPETREELEMRAGGPRKIGAYLDRLMQRESPEA